MSALVSAVEDYLALRRSLGFTLHRIDGLLLDFVAELEAGGLERITTEAALAWATKPAGADPYWHAKRLGCVRRFAVYLNALDPRCEVPPRGLLAERARRATPHLYSAQEVRALMSQARLLAPRLRGASYEALIGLLAVTGMRPGETVRLQRRDVDLAGGIVRVLASKNDSRELPLHPSAVNALSAYGRLRDELYPRPAGTAFFLSAAGTPIARETLIATFARLRRGAGLDPPPGSGRAPRLHDFRHSFALRCLLDWYRSGADVAALLPRLSTYLGHRDPASTYWYLTATPELLALAARRLEPGQEAKP